MVSGTRNRGSHHRGAGAAFRHPVGQAGVDEAHLKKYHQAKELVAPQERDEEKRNVHRVREYWLEYEAVQHLDALLELKIPVATFESHFLQVNAHNPKYSRATLRETLRSFFREHVDENGVKFLTLKLSERPVCTKPSKNILKRWNLSNGMLYFFYAAVGRSSPPSGDEILEPFYYQKRIDFIRKVCSGPSSSSSVMAPAAGVASDQQQQAPPSPAAVTAAGVNNGNTSSSTPTTTTIGGDVYYGKNDFFFGPGVNTNSSSTRKRRRGEAGAAIVKASSPSPPRKGGIRKAPLPLAELYIPSEATMAPTLGPATPHSLSSSMSTATTTATVKTEEVEKEVVATAAGGGEAEVDHDAIVGLYEYLKAQVWSQVEEAAVAAAVEARVWQLVKEEGVDTEGAERDLAYLSRPLRSFWVPNLELLEQWSFENGALPVFVRACRLHWHRVEAAWSQWNDDLGNNALEWDDLWRCARGTGPDYGEDFVDILASSSSSITFDNKEDAGLPSYHQIIKTEEPTFSCGAGGGAPSSATTMAPVLHHNKAMATSSGNPSNEDFFSNVIDLGQDDEGQDCAMMPFLNVDEEEEVPLSGCSPLDSVVEEDDGLITAGTSSTTAGSLETTMLEGGNAHEWMMDFEDTTDAELQEALLMMNAGSAGLGNGGPSPSLPSSQQGEQFLLLPNTGYGSAVDDTAAYYGNNGNRLYPSLVEQQHPATAYYSS